MKPTPLLAYLILATFLAGGGLILTELALRLLPARAAVFAASVLVCWLVLDNLTLASDLAGQRTPPTADSQTATEIHRKQTTAILRALAHEKAAHAATTAIFHTLAREKAAHAATAARLDRFDDAVLAALHWSALASRVIVLTRMHRVVGGRREGGMMATTRGSRSERCSRRRRWSLTTEDLMETREGGASQGSTVKGC